LQTYLFYDIETTGLNKAFDQVLHFAAIRTDLNFKELNRYDIKIKLNPDIIPSPYAMLTHHMRLQEIAKGICEHEAMKQIHQCMNMPGTISVGYNTMGFDDEFLRFSFYRNLLSPYTHQFANRCARMDIYPITIMYFLFKHSILNWPKKGEKNSLKLEDLNQANQFASGRAHDAMVDVEVTLALAKKLSEEREMWDYVSGHFNKKIDQDRLQKLEQDEALMVLGRFGSEKKFQSIVLSLGKHYHYSNQLLWLRLDEKDFSKETQQTIVQSTYVTQKKLGEPGFLLPLKDRFIQHIDTERLTLAKKNKQWLYENPAIFKHLSDYYRGYQYPVYPETDIDASLYLNGFWSREEESFCKLFHAASSEEKARLVDAMKNPKLFTLALRILGRNFPDILSAKQAEQFSQHLLAVNPSDDAKAMIDFKGERRLTPKIALQQIAELREQNQLDNHKLELLMDLERTIKLCHVKSR
jgi:exodeoxyribonuclease-1